MGGCAGLGDVNSHESESGQATKSREINTDGQLDEQDDITTYLSRIVRAGKRS